MIKNLNFIFYFLKMTSATIKLEYGDIPKETINEYIIKNFKESFNL